MLAVGRKGTVLYETAKADFNERLEQRLAEVKEEFCKYLCPANRAALKKGCLVCSRNMSGAERTGGKKEEMQSKR